VKMRNQLRILPPLLKFKFRDQIGSQNQQGDNYNASANTKYDTTQSICNAKSRTNQGLCCNPFEDCSDKQSAEKQNHRTDIDSCKLALYGIYWQDGGELAGKIQGDQDSRQPENSFIEAY